MNRYLHAGICIGIGIIKGCTLKITRGKEFSMAMPALISPRTEITVDRGGCAKIGKMLRLRSGAKLRVRKNAYVDIGTNCSFSNNCMIVSRERIIIGDNVQFGPGVLVYDHDHDYSTQGGLAEEKYKMSPVMIGEGTWIGANSIILRGSEIGKNCVVAAGTIVKGKYPDDVIIYQDRVNKVKSYCKETK